MNIEVISGVLIFIVITVIVVIIIKKIVGKIVRWYVSNDSKLLSGVKLINSRYKFKIISPELKFDTYVNSKSKFDEFDVEGYFDTIILVDSGGIVEQAEAVLYNRQLYGKYSDEITDLKYSLKDTDRRSLKIFYKWYTNIEKELLEELKLKPITSGIVTCTVSYTRAAGREKYSRHKQYGISVVPQRYERLQEQLQKLSEEDGWKGQSHDSKLSVEVEKEVARRKRERALMTPKLRYSILKRDGFKCVLCGRTQEDGVKLHVDHIIPVSKGGKTVPENLRTLCADCNLGKSDEIE